MVKINRELINVKKVIIDTGEEKMIYDQANVAQVFKTSPDKRGRLYLGTKNKVIVIELKDSI